MKLLITVISKDDVNEMTEKLSKNLISTSVIANTRSFFTAYTSTILVLCEDEQVKDAIKIIKETCSARPAQYVNSNYGSQLIEFCQEGGGAIIVVDVDQFVRL